MDNTKFWRQLDIANPEKLQKTVTVLGAGSVGSFSVLSMAKVGISNIQVIDFDKVELHNLPNQFYRKQDLEKYKVDALRDIVAEFTETNIIASNSKWNSSIPLLSKVVITALDNMPTRKEAFNACKYNPVVERFIDPRMGAELMRIYSINPNDPDDIEFYEKTLYAEGEELPCTARSIIYNVEVIAGLVSALAVKHMIGVTVPKEIIFDIKTWQYLKRA